MSVGDYVGGRLSRLYETLPLPALFGTVVLFCLLIAGALLFLRKPMRQLMGDVNSLLFGKAKARRTIPQLPDDPIEE